MTLLSTRRILTLACVALFANAAIASAPADAPVPNATQSPESAAIAKGAPPSAVIKPTGVTPADAPPAMAAPESKPFVYRPKMSDVVIGKAEAPVTMVEYASLSCPHCSHFYTTVLPQLTNKYIDSGKVKLIYRNYPLNDPALKAAELVQCAEPDRREAFVKVLFTTQTKWAYDMVGYRDALGNIAVLGGFDRLQFEACMNNKDIEKTILDVAKEAADDYHVTSTPTFYINGVEARGDHDFLSMSKLIDAAIEKQAKK